MAFVPFELTPEDARRMTVPGALPTIDEQPASELAADETPAPDDARPFLGLHNAVQELVTVGCLECELPYSDAAEEAGCLADDPQALAAFALSQQDARRAGNVAPGMALGGVGRNDPCPCGSGLKYKKCHGR